MKATCVLIEIVVELKKNNLYGRGSRWGMDEKVRLYIKEMERKSPAQEEKIKEVEERFGICFPAQYKEFLLESNGIEGTFGDFAYLVIWPIEDVCRYNLEYEVNTYNPGVVYFGSDGGGEIFAFDFRKKDITIVMLSTMAIDLDDMELYSSTFHEFLEKYFIEDWS